jgi:thiopeptide-type bacteriocin biosynthesis protein
MKKIERTFMPGSRWLYIKMYTGVKTADDILVKAILPVSVQLMKNGWIEKWFFIRYADPDYHLRIRFSVSVTSNIAEILEIINKKLSSWNKSGQLWKIQLDTYNRESERYGEDTMEDSETVFCIDSEYIIRIVGRLNKNEDYRWMIALKLIDSILSDFSFELKEKQLLMETVQKSYKSEFGYNEFNAKQFNHKYREKKKTVESVLSETNEDREFIELYKIVSKRSNALKKISRIIIEKTKISKQENKLNSLLQSYIHMTLNRLFLSKNRLHELILYDFMNRYYKSEIAKTKKS